MAKLKITLNSSGIRALLKSNEIVGACQEKAKQIAKAAGSGYSTDTHIGVTRGNASVFPETEAAIRDNYKNNTLLKSMR